MKKYFWLEESAMHPHKFILRADFDTMPLVNTTGSFNILPARLLGMNFADYLRVCRDVFGAEVMGKKGLYPVALFPQSTETEMLLKILNKRVELIMAMKEGVAAQYEEEYRNEYEETFGVTLNGDIFVEKEVV